MNRGPPMTSPMHKLKQSWISPPVPLSGGQGWVSGVGWTASVEWGVGSGSGSIPGSRLPQLIGCFLTFEPRLFMLGGLKWPGAAPTTSKRVLS